MNANKSPRLPDGRVVVTFDEVPIELPALVGHIVLDHINSHGPASYPVGQTTAVGAGCSQDASPRGP